VWHQLALLKKLKNLHAKSQISSSYSYGPLSGLASHFVNCAKLCVTFCYFLCMLFIRITSRVSLALPVCLSGLLKAIQATKMGLSMLILEIPAQRKFYPARCHAYKPSHTVASTGLVQEYKL